MSISGALLIAGGYSCSGVKKTTESSFVDTIYSNINGQGLKLEIEFTKGKEHNHPLMAIWIEDINGKYIETIYVAESIGKGIFQHGNRSDGQWQEGPVRRPAALPYWGHKRGIKAEDGLFIPTPADPMPDAVTGPTPQGDFLLTGNTSKVPEGKFKVMMEINQSWDWNQYWTNNKYPDDPDYKTSSQPALVYEASIDPASPVKEYTLVPVGHSHYSGRDGSLTVDLSTITTALEIADEIKIKILP